MPTKKIKKEKADCKVKDDTKKLKKSKNDKDVPAEQVDFSKEKPGEYSTAHIIFKLRRIRDNSLNHVDECAQVKKWKGMGAAEQAFEMAMNNIERVETKEAGLTCAGKSIKIEIPGFDPSQIKISPPKDDAEKP